MATRVMWLAWLRGRCGCRGCEVMWLAWLQEWCGCRGCKVIWLVWLQGWCGWRGYRRRWRRAAGRGGRCSRWRRRWASSCERTPWSRCRRRGCHAGNMPSPPTADSRGVVQGAYWRGHARGGMYWRGELQGLLHGCTTGFTTWVYGGVYYMGVRQGNQ